MAIPSKNVRNATSSKTGQIARVAVFSTGCSIMPVIFATASTPERARTIPTKTAQLLPKSGLGHASSTCGKCGRVAINKTPATRDAAIAMIVATLPPFPGPTQLMAAIAKIDPMAQISGWLKLK